MAPQMPSSVRSRARAIWERALSKTGESVAVMFSGVAAIPLPTAA